MTRQSWLDALAVVITIVFSELLLKIVDPIYTNGIQTAYRYDKDLGITLRESVTLR